MTKKQQRHTIASVGTAVLMLLLFLLLWFIRLSAVRPEEEEGVEVAFGEVSEAGGYESQQSEAVPLPAPQQASPAPSAAPSDNDLMTQEDEEALALRKEQEKKERERRQAEAAEKQRQREEQARLEAERKAREQAEAERRAKEAEAIAKANAMGAIIGQAGSNTGSGDSQGSGQKGNPVGKGSSGVRDGRIQGLNGRNPREGKLPEPTCEFDHYGVVVVQIKIDKDGNNVFAVSARGTNTADKEMIQCAIDACRKVKWTAGEGEAIGSITYTFTNTNTNQ